MYVMFFLIFRQKIACVNYLVENLYNCMIFRKKFVTLY